MKKFAFLLILSSVIVNAIFGCDFFNSALAPTYTISFSVVGGEPIASISADKDTKTTLPVPIKNGHLFLGWYKENSYITIFTDDDLVTSNLLLYAKWQVISYDIIFNSRGGNSVETMEVPFGDLIMLPDAPTKNDGIFAGWYLDENLLEPLNFSFMPAAHVTLYARWVYENEDPYDFLNSDPSNILQSFEAFVNYVDYILFNRLAEASVTFAYMVDSFEDEIDKAFASKHIQSNASMHFMFQPDTQVLTITTSFQAEAYLSASNDPQYQQRIFYSNEILSTRDETYNTFKIYDIDKTYSVTTSDQLYYVMEKGYRPIFLEQGTIAETMYEAAKSVLREIVDDSMSDVQKLSAIYMWLVDTVTYDAALLEKLNMGEPNLSMYKGFFLEGVFIDQRAVCDGFSKAFLVMARIEGITAIRVIGKSVNPSVTALHAWNKVYLGENWYVIDATSANVIMNNTIEVFTHAFFMIDDETMEQRYIATSNLEIEAIGEYNIYQQFTFEVESQVYTRIIESQEALNALFKYYMSLGEPTVSIDSYINFDYGESLNDNIQTAMQASSMPTIVFSTINNVLIVWQSNDLHD